MRLAKFKTIYTMVALTIAALSLGLSLLASNPQTARAVTASSTPTATPSPTATASPTATLAPLPVNAGEAEFSVSSDPTGVPTGSVQLNVTNHGAIAHE